jgi:NAD+ kinase
LNERVIERVGIFHHPRKPESLALAEEIAEMLRQEEREPWVSSSWDKEAIEAQVSEFDLIITLGGDGSILRAARLGARYDVPILGVKMGRISFLGEVAPEEWLGTLQRVLSGDYWLEEHMMLQAVAWRGDTPISQTHEALNEVVVSRGRLARVVRTAARVDGSQLTTYSADGVIVSTATGSTGYALAVGGPVLPPELKNILLIPIAAHLSLDRAVVLPQGATVELQIFTDHQAILTVDGQFLVELQSGDVVRVGASPYQAHFVRVQERVYFYKTLMDRLSWVA